MVDGWRERREGGGREEVERVEGGDAGWVLGWRWDLGTLGTLGNLGNLGNLGGGAGRSEMRPRRVGVRMKLDERGREG